MAKDIIVDRVEWESIMNVLFKYDETLRNNMTEYKNILDTLVNNGFIEGEVHNNLATYAKLVSDLKEVIDGLYNRVQPIVRDFLDDVDAEDDFRENAVVVEV